MTTTSFDQAQHNAWAQDAETPAETEEREARAAGMWLFDAAPDSEFVADADQAACDYATYADMLADEERREIEWSRDGGNPDIAPLY